MNVMLKFIYVTSGLLSMVCIVLVSGCTSEISVMSSGRSEASKCAASTDNDENFCDKATDLQWQTTGFTAPQSVTAKWTKSTSKKLKSQAIEFYGDASCATKLSEAVAIPSSSVESYIYSAVNGVTLTFKIISYDESDRKNISACSDALTINASTTTTSTTTTVNDTIAPTISSINASSSLANSSSAPIYFTISDNNSSACSATYLAMTSSNTSLVANDSVVWSGLYPYCSAVITPVSGASGNATIQFTVRDAGGNTASTSFSFSVSSSIALGQISTSTASHLRYGLRPTDVVTIGGKFIVANYNGVNIYNSVPTSPSQSPDVIVGRTGPEDYTPVSAAASASITGVVGSIATDGTKLIVSDTGFNRVLIWNTVPAVSGTAADVVIGQADMVSSAINGGGSTAANVLSAPRGVATDGTRLFVADTNNHRVLIWNTIPTTSFTPADVVIGQATFTANAGAITATGFNRPFDVATDGTKLVVADRDSHRVLIWNTIPGSNGVAANVVLGQPNFTSNTYNNGGISPSSLASPEFVSLVNNRLIVGDSGNYRNLVWNSIPASSNLDANIVIGQSNLTSRIDHRTTGVSGATAQGSGRAALIGGKLYIADSYSSRVGVWNSFPTTDGQAMDAVLGQSNTSGNLYFNHGQNAVSLTSAAVATNGTKFVLADQWNGRVLIWNSIPTSHSSLPDVVLGQPNFYSAGCYNGGVTASSLCDPGDVKIIGTKLVVADSTSCRVLIWNSIPTVNNQPADIVLGQPDFTNWAMNNGGRSASSMAYPTFVYSDGAKFYVVDQGNHRVLVWNSFPTTSGQAANYVLGQTTFSAGTLGITSSKLRYPTSIVSIGTKLFISDQANRILGWNTIPTTSGAVADFVLGQGNFTTGTENTGGVSASSLSLPWALATDGSKLLAADMNNHRVLIWNSISGANAQAASLVMGQADFTSQTINSGGLSESSLVYPNSIAISGGKIFIGDSGNQRVLIKNYP